QRLASDTGLSVTSVEYCYNSSYSSDNFDPLITDLALTLRQVEEAIATSVRSIAREEAPIYYYLVLAYMQSLFKPHQPNFCPASRNYFTVSHVGQVYPCQNLPETPSTLIGDVADPNLAKKIETAAIRRRIDEANR